jgi:G patch domain-containing protein 1
MSFKRSRAAFESGTDEPPHHAPFAVYGTPLPAYDADARDDGSYVPVWKQEVTDERGRKRLHGAFTGGFSAGYFNTVGSKEGWAPSTFVSSRANRAKDAKEGKQQRAEDFMDEEDLAEQAESQKLETQQAFAGLGGGSGDGVRKGMFSDLFRSTGETKGMKLLQRMGWRQGQGIGPKVRRRAQGDANGETHLFAPDNTKMISFVKKNDRKGLGFAGEGKLEDVTGVKTSMQDDEEDSGDDARILRTNRSKVTIKAKPTKKSGFGVGVLNNDGSDDEDPYSMGPRISYNRIIGADKKKKKGGLVASSTTPGVIKPSFTSKKLAQRTNASAGFRKCHDGRLPLEGFVLALSALNLAEENHYPPPTIPADWKPAQQSANPKSTTNFVSTSDAAKASDLTPAARASLLGEAALPGKSIFSYLTPAARERLANATQNQNLPPALGEQAPEGYVPDAASQTRTLWDFVPTLSKETAALALHRGRTGWMPYAEDEGKRERYAGFLELSAGLKSDLPTRAQGQSREEWSNELREFAEAAEIFRPAEGFMALKFTTGSGKTEGGNVDDTEAKVPGLGREEDAAEKAAKMGMFGPLTRSKIPFYPTRLLCKRFNVKPPPNVMGQADSDGRGGGNSAAASGQDGQKRLELVSQANIDRMMMEANFSKNFARGGVEGGRTGEEAESAQPPQVERVQVDAERNEALEGKRAGEDIFKAVFGSDSEDD